VDELVALASVPSEMTEATWESSISNLSLDIGGKRQRARLLASVRWFLGGSYRMKGRIIGSKNTTSSGEPSEERDELKSDTYSFRMHADGWANIMENFSIMPGPLLPFSEPPSSMALVINPNLLSSVRHDIAQQTTCSLESTSAVSMHGMTKWAVEALPMTTQIEGNL
jgi:hypothetical protein